MTDRHPDQISDAGLSGFRLPVMLKYYAVVAARNLCRHRTMTFINTVGLGIGMACCILAVSFARYHLSWDDVHTHRDRIYRVLWKIDNEGSVTSNTAGPLAPALKETFPEVVHAVRLFAKHWPAWLITPGSSRRIELQVTDPEIFDVFDLPLVTGDARTVFETPYAIVVTESAAKRYFGDTNVIGRTITLEAYMGTGDYTITGVMRDPPDNSRFRGDEFFTTTRVGTVSIEQQQQRSESSLWWDEWRASGFRAMQTFVLLRSPEDAGPLTEKLQPFLARNLGDEVAAKHRYGLQPLGDIHARGESHGIRSETSIRSIYLVAGISTVILLVACVNFVNLSIARATVRRREVGIRKATGALRADIITQFMFESLVTTVLGALLGVAFAMLSASLFEAHGGLELPELTLLDGTGFYVAGIAVLVALLAGTYPALIVSGFHPVRALRAGTSADTGRGLLRQGLSVCQFATCVLLVLGSVVMYRQTQFLLNRDLGFDKDLVITMPIFTEDRDRKPDWGKHLSYRWRALKNDVLQHPNVLAASAFASLPGVHGAPTTRFETEGREVRIPLIRTDEDYIDFFGLEVTRGVGFAVTKGRDVTRSKGNFDIILNESAVRMLGWDDPIGKELNLRNGGFQPDGTVIGVVKDFHVGNLRQPIKPLAILYSVHILSHLGVRVRPDSLPETIAFLKEFWERRLPERPFQYSFLDDRIERVYRSELQTAALVTDFSVMGILLGCMGLFGLTAFVVERRTREVGIRKSLGASISDIVLRLSKESGVILVAANILAWPIGYVLLRDWLEQFVYKIDLHVGYFLLAGGGTALIAWITVWLQALPAARANPVNALRHE